MKYIRKLVALLIAVVLLAAVSIGIGVIYAVKNVNVSIISYTCSSESEAAKQKIAEFKEDILSEVHGKLISSVGKEKISSAISDEYYSVVDIKKVYPCTLNVTLKERRETFTVSNADGSYSVYDENGTLMRRVQTVEQTCNKSDGLPNLPVSGAEESDYKNISRICTVFADKFGAIRSVAENAVLTKGIEEAFTFNLRCGVSIIIYDYTVLTEEKITAVYEYFSQLSGAKKMSGEIHCFVNADKQVFATYR